MEVDITEFKLYLVKTLGVWSYGVHVDLYEPPASIEIMLYFVNDGEMMKSRCSKTSQKEGSNENKAITSDTGIAYTHGMYSSLGQFYKRVISYNSFNIHVCSNKNKAYNVFQIRTNEKVLDTYSNKYERVRLNPSVGHLRTTCRILRGSMIGEILGHNNRLRS
jgi:hypothetical protein